MSYMNKELDDMSKEFDGIRAQIARLEKMTAEISDMKLPQSIRWPLNRIPMKIKMKI